MAQLIHILMFVIGLLNLADSRNRLHDRNRRPNIVVIMTDDQDEALGSMNSMPKTLRIMQDGGVHFRNSFVTTPVCCPSRSSFLTGLYAHNHKVYTNAINCSSSQWRETMESRSFATYLSNAGYRTGYFGKYLNQYDGKHIPAGWREWLGLVRNSAFYNYTVNFNGMMIQKGDNYYEDYFTDLIANDSVNFLKLSKRLISRGPVLMVLSTPAPHGPEDAAPQYQHMFMNNTSHRTPAWNYAPNMDKYNFLQLKDKMTEQEKTFTDLLHTKRLQTLQSVDDLVEKVYHTLIELDELDNTYMIFTSDHGYHLGQFGVAKGKTLPYDFDIRVPLYIRGPGISERSVISNIVTNVDLAPTILDMAGIQTPSHMDGRSMLQLLEAYRDGQVDESRFTTTVPQWKDTILIESGNPLNEHKQHKGLFRFIRPLSFYNPRQVQTLRKCTKPDYQEPCQPGQKYYCVRKRKRKMLGMLRCPKKNFNQGTYPVKSYNKKCKCKRKRNKLSNTVISTPCVSSNDTACSVSNVINPKNWDTQRRTLSDMMREFKKMILDLKLIRKHLRKRRPKLKRYKDRKALRSIKRMNYWNRNNRHINHMDRDCISFRNGTTTCRHRNKMDANFIRNHNYKIGRLIPKYHDVVYTMKRYIQQFKHVMTNNFVPDRLDQEDNCDCVKDRRNQRRKRFEYKRTRLRRNKNARNHVAVSKNVCLKPKHYSEDVDLKNHLTDPCFWNLRPGEKLMRRFHPLCKSDILICHLVDSNTWLTPPFWTHDPMCICINILLSTYKCVRTVNRSRDILYCEFGEEFKSFYDLNTDPYQLRNVIESADPLLIQQLHNKLHLLSSCQGQSDCNMIL